MLVMPPPSTQKADYRPISFVLDDQTTGSPPVSVNLAIRPEDLTRTDQSRLNVQQTLGGAWGDNFGPGIPQIMISGTTGWRRGIADGLDGSERFTQLYEQVYQGWHQGRQNAIAAGQDPDKVQLVFADALDNMAVVVTPNTFVLRRSKSRPLLFQYQIAMTVVDQSLDLTSYLQNSSGGFLDADITQSTGLDSFAQSMTDLAVYATSIAGYVSASLAGGVTGFLNLSMGVFGTVMSAVSSGSSNAGQLVGIGRLVADAGITVFRTLASIGSATTAGLGCIMGIVGAITNIWCLLKNALNLQIYIPDFSSLFGASNCSSTNGGSPVSIFANSNPFYSVVPIADPLPIQLTQGAQVNLAMLAANDPVLSPLSPSALGTALTAINSGMSISP
jgi:hypothetical protein